MSSQNDSKMTNHRGTSISRRAKGLAKCFWYNKISLYQGSFPYILLFAEAKKIVCYTNDFIWRFVKSRFHFNSQEILLSDL